MELENGVRYVFKKRDNIYTVNNVDETDIDKSEVDKSKSDKSNSNKIFNKDVRFTATVVDILCNESTGYKTLRVEEMVYENDKIKIPGMVTMPYDWIESACPFAHGWVREDI